MLETGDGRISKFSGDGAAIQDLMRARYTSKDCLQALFSFRNLCPSPLQEGSLLRKFHVISADKKLTHDLMELAGCLAGCMHVQNLKILVPGTCQRLT